VSETERKEIPATGRLDYETSKILARDPDPAVRRQIAAREDVRPELLYYLAVDPAVEVRREVAANLSAPAQASAMLARDADDSVRQLIATKLARVLPDLSQRAQTQLYEFAIQTLEQLAHDRAVEVRQALATTLADVACAPPDMCADLARDVERRVAEPILHYCVTVTDKDLLAIITDQPQSWVLSAIAQRATVSPELSAAIYDAGDIAASTALIDNAGAIIPEPTLAQMIEESVYRPGWQGSLARRPRLPGQLALRLAEFVDQHVLAILQYQKFDPETAAEVVSVARRRLVYKDDYSGEMAEQRVGRLYNTGGLNDQAISDALSWNDQDFVRLALAVLSAVPPATVQHILDSQNAKGVTALAWRAGLGMRCAMQLQARGANISPRYLLNARNGTDYPLSQAEMIWQLEFYGIRL
jgi:uncharacterized protein (DUF2336 family)